MSYYLLWRYDSSKGMESLEVTWVSRANALQRRGRAGRVASGVCFHLFTQHRYDNHFREQPVPEIQRVPLESLILRIKILDLFKDEVVEVRLQKHSLIFVKDLYAVKVCW